MTHGTTDKASTSTEPPDRHAESTGKYESRESILLGALNDLASMRGLEDLLERAIVTLIDVAGASWAGIFLCDPLTDSFRVRVHRGSLRNEELLEKLTGYFETGSTPFAVTILRERKPVQYSTAEDRPFLNSFSCSDLGIGRALVLPILIPELVLGWGVVLNEDDSSSYTGEEIEVLGSLVGALAPVIELTRLKADFSRHHAERRTLQEVTTAILQEYDLQKAMELVCRGAQQVTEAGGSAILLLDEEGVLRVVSSIGDAADWPEQVLSEVLTSTPPRIPIEPVLMDDLGSALALPEAHIVKSIVVVPLTVHGKSLGVLQLVNLKNNIQEDQLRAISLFADRVAIAIEHVKLHQEHERAAVLEERHRLAHDLHDSVTQSIYGVTVYTEAVARFLQSDRIDEAIEAFGELRDASLNALREMRALIFELHPPEVAKMGLVAALQARLAAVESRAGIRTELHLEGIATLPTRIEEGLYRIIREALNNCMKHAHASCCILHLEQTGEGIRLQLEDDGVGFDMDGDAASSGMGMSSMHDRIESMGGSIQIESSPGEGTRIIIEVPLTGGEET